MSCSKCTLNYFPHLSSDSFYNKKLKLIKFDPYISSKCEKCLWTENRAKLPSLNYFDLYNYMVGKHKHQEYRVMAVKTPALKSLASYDQFACGWVRNVRCLIIDEVLSVVMANVRPSMKLNQDDRLPWVIINTVEQEVLTAHCTCEAGLGESCSHVGALLFHIIFATQKNDESVTESFAYWMLPAQVNSKLLPQKLSDVSFTKPRITKRKRGEYLNINVQTEAVTNPFLQLKDMEHFLKDLDAVRPKSSILNVVAPFNVARNVPDYTLTLATTDSAVDPSSQLKLSFGKCIIRGMENETLNSLILSCSVDELDIYYKYVAVDSNVAEKILHATQDQSNSLWHAQRKLRFTGSKSYALFTYAGTVDKTIKEARCMKVLGDITNSIQRSPATKTDTKARAQLLWSKKFDSEIFSDFAGNKFTRYGLEKEQVCAKLYEKKYPQFHKKIGFCINENYPWLGYSPDGIVVKEGIQILVEIKCLQCARHIPSTELNQTNCPFLDEENRLKKRHRFHGQIQLGLFVANLSEAVLVLYSDANHDFLEISVPFDQEFNEIFIPRLTSLYFQFYLPILTNKKHFLQLVEDCNKQL